MRERNAESISSSVAVKAVWRCEGRKTRSTRFKGDTANEETAEEELPAIRMGRFYRRATPPQIFRSPSLRAQRIHGLDACSPDCRNQARQATDRQHRQRCHS